MPADDDAIERFEDEGGPSRDEASPAGDISIGVALSDTETAIALLSDEERHDASEVDQSQRPRVERHYTVLRLEHLPTGQTEEVVNAITNVVHDVGPRDCRLDMYVDVDGAGTAVFPKLEAQALPARIWQVTITTGDEYEVEDRIVRAGHGALLARLQQLLKDDQLHLPADPDLLDLKDKLLEAESQPDSSNPAITAIALALHGLPRRPWGPL